MKLTTYFRAFTLCLQEKEHAREARGDIFGIMGCTDNYALLYRRRCRQERKLYNLLWSSIGGESSPTCWKCGFTLWEGKCKLDCYKEIGIPIPWSTWEKK